MPNLGDNIAYSATYTPGNATLPVTYSWSISPVTAGVITPNSNSANINIQWNETGNHNLLLSTTNCGGTQTHSQIISVVAAPSPVTPVAPSPIAPSPVAPSPTTPVAPSPVYDKCALTINWDNPSVICNGDNTSTVTVSVNGNNGEAVEFSVNGGAYVAANSGVNGYVSTFTSNGDNFTYDARIVSCSNSIQGVVQVCAASPAPTAPSPSPIAPSPSPVTPVAPSPVYDKCALNIYWNTPNVTCNGDNTSTIEVSVDGDNGEQIEFSINGGAFTNANISNSNYSFTVTSNGDSFSIDARVVGCSNSINGTVQACAAAPSPVAPSPIAPSPVAPSPVACIGVSSVSVSGNTNAVAGNTETYTGSYLPANADVSSFYWGISPTNAGTINGSNTGSSISVTWNNTGNNTVYFSIGACGNPVVDTNYAVNVTSAPSPVAPSPVAPPTVTCVPVTFGSINHPNGSLNENVFEQFDVVHDGDGPFTYSWSVTNPDGSVTSYGFTGNGGSIKFNQCGSTTVNVVVTNCSGSSVTASTTFDIINTPAAPIISLQSGGSAGTVVNIDVTGFNRTKTLNLYVNHPPLIGFTLDQQYFGMTNNNPTTIQYTLPSNNGQIYITTTECGVESGASNVVIY